MVRVPGSSEDAGFHRESQDEEDVKVKIKQKTDEPLEDRPPVTQEEKNKGSKDRPDLGRGPANMVKAEILKINLNTLPTSSSRTPWVMICIMPQRTISLRNKMKGHGPQNNKPLRSPNPNQRQSG